MNDVIQKKLDMMDESPPLSLEEVDFGFRSKPTELSTLLADPWKYDAITELRTGGPAGFASMIETIVPSAKDPTSALGQYLPRWLKHEIPHGNVVVEALKTIGEDPPGDLPEEMPPIVGYLGRITSSLPWLGRIAEGVVATQGTRNERMTLDHYLIERQMLQELGEHGFIETALMRIIKQEAIHLAWNRATLKGIVSESSNLQLRLIAALDKALWMPVGAKSRQFRGHLSRAAKNLADGREDRIVSMAEGVQRVVDETLETKLPRRRSQEFVLKRILALIPSVNLVESSSN